MIKITLDVASAKVSVEIYATKSVPIEVNLRGTPGDGYGVEGVVYQPQSVERGWTGGYACQDRNRRCG